MLESHDETGGKMKQLACKFQGSHIIFNQLCDYFMDVFRKNTKNYNWLSVISPSTLSLLLRLRSYHISW